MDKLPVAPLGSLNNARADATPTGNTVHISNRDGSVAVDRGDDADVAVITVSVDENRAIFRSSVDTIALSGELTRPIARVTEAARKGSFVIMAPLPSVPSTPTPRHRVAAG